MIKEEAMGEKNRMVQFLYQWPPIIVMLGSSLLFFLAGYVLGMIIFLMPGVSFDIIDLASFCGLIVGFCGSVLFLMRKE